MPKSQQEARKLVLKLFDETIESYREFCGAAKANRRMSRDFAEKHYGQAKEASQMLAALREEAGEGGYGKAMMDLLRIYPLAHFTTSYKRLASIYVARTTKGREAVRPRRPEKV